MHILWQFTMINELLKVQLCSSQGMETSDSYTMDCWMSLNYFTPRIIRHAFAVSYVICSDEFLTFLWNFALSVNVVNFAVKLDLTCTINVIFNLY